MDRRSPGAKSRVGGSDAADTAPRLLPRPVTVATMTVGAAGALASVAAAVGWGWGNATSVLLGSTIGVGFFWVSAIAVAAAERVMLTLMLPVAVVVYATLLSGLGVLAARLTDDSGIHRQVVGLSLLGAVLLWLTVLISATLASERTSRGEHPPPS